MQSVAESRDHFAAKRKAKPDQKWKQNVSAFTSITETVDTLETHSREGVELERVKQRRESDTRNSMQACYLAKT